MSAAQKTWADYGIELPHGAGVEVDTVCPQCSQQRRKKRARCLSVNTDKGVWVCHHCGWRGNLQDGEEQSNILHWRPPRYRKPERIKLTGLPEKTLGWFRRRGISEKVLARNRVGCTDAWIPQVEERRPCIVFPYFRAGEVVNRKYRDAEKNFRMEAGAERLLYGLDDIAQTTIICEGEIDKLSLEEAGFQNVVSVPDGAPAPESKAYAAKFDYLDDERLSAVSEWIIAVDADPPGQRLEIELVRRFGPECCKRVTWPAGFKDANEVLVRQGRNALAEAVRSAREYPIEGVYTSKDLAEAVFGLYEHGWQRGASTGWLGLDEFYTVRPGELTVITGIPGAGKSNWLDCLTLNLAKHEGWRIAMFSPENQPLERHAAGLAEKFSGKPFRQGPTERMSPDDVEHSLSWMAERFYWILPADDSTWTMDEILERARQLVTRRGIQGLVLDPWNEFEQERPPGVTETEYVSSTLKHVRAFARRHVVHVWFVAHPQKLYRNVDGKYPKPTLYDISGSANWRNKADNGIVVWRDPTEHDSPDVEIHVAKVRFREVGKRGYARLRYESVTATYR